MSGNVLKVDDLRKDKSSAYMNAHVTFSYRIIKDIGFGHEGRKMEREGIIRADDLETVAESMKAVIEEYYDEFEQK